MRTNCEIALRVLFLACCCTGPGTLAAERLAAGRLSCASVSVQRGQGPFNLYTLEISSVPGATNGELAPLPGQYTHRCYFVMNDPSGFDPIIGTINVDVPLDNDLNQNGYADFYEVSQDGSGTSSGFYIVPGVVPQGGISARWTRAAESTQGTCVLTLEGLGDFGHTFEIIEFQGLLSYRPGATNVFASVNLTQSGHPENTLTGQMEFRKLTADPFNRMLLQPGAWTNQAQETLSFPQDLFQRDPDWWPTNYYGFIELDNDSEPSTYYPYGLFLLSIDDLNDTDGDGIPDLSDNPAVPTAPVLSLSSSHTNLLLEIRGEVGRAHILQRAAQLPGTWQTIGTVTLTNNPHPLFLPVPEEPTTFWRLQVQ